MMCLNQFQKSPVTFLRSASAIDRLLVLCDATLYVLRSHDLTPLPLAGSKMKGVTACCANENPTTNDPFSIQVCVAKKKQLAVMSIGEQKMVVEKTKDVQDLVREVAMDGNFVCAALQSHYVLFDVDTGGCQDLFPFDPEGTPIVLRIAKVTCLVPNHLQ